MTHTYEKPHQCRYCVKSFPTPSTRKRHEMTHTGGKPHQCSYCVKSFITLYQKKKHEVTKHTGEKLQCGNSGEKQLPNVVLHQVIQEMPHTEEKPHQCSYCA